MIIKKSHFDSNETRVYETLFTVSNGHVGTRGSFDFNQNVMDEDVGTFVNGFYEKEPIVYGESAFGYAKNHQRLLRIPNFKTIELKHASKSLNPKLLDHYLDLSTGMLNQFYDHELIEIKSQRFASMVDENYIVSKYEIMPKQSFTLTLKSIVGLENQILKNITDPRKHQFDVNKLSYSFPDFNTLKIETINSCLSLYIRQSIYLNENHYYLTQKNNQLEEEISLNLIESEKQVFYRVTYVSDIHDSQAEFDVDLDFLNPNKLYEDQLTYYHTFWEENDIKIKGNDVLQRNVRFNMFHLNQAAAQDGKRNIAAKGISSDGYEGHYFWDTEMYMLPFFIHHEPETARKLLEFRHYILPKSRERARELGIEKGALYAWRTINGEECSAYYPAGTAQVHINADIAFAIHQYYNATHDEAFMKNYGVEMLIEFAWFWEEYGFFNDEGVFEIHEVTGPDEYTTLVNNNFYTNKMVQETLKFTANYLLENQDLLSRFNITVEDVKLWKLISDKMYLGYDEKLGLIKQDDTFLEREIWPFDKVPKSKYPLLLHFHPLTIYRYQVNKQADTVFALYLFRDQYSREFLQRNYDYYDKITTHDSSLSRAIFSMMGSHLKNDKSYNYFVEVSHTDLNDLQGNSVDGIHAANMGGTWMGIVYGFLGLQVKKDKIIFRPFLPQEIDEVKIKLKIHSNIISVVLNQNQLIVSANEKYDNLIEIDGNLFRMEENFKIVYDI